MKNRVKSFLKEEQAMQVNSRFISFPPYLSTSWEHVRAIHKNPQGSLTFFLVRGETVSLPPLGEEEIGKIYRSHAEFLEDQVLKKTAPQEKPLSLKEIPFRFAIGSSDEFQKDALTAMQHTEQDKHLPDLPEEITKKIAEVIRILAPKDEESLPKPEPHCNCAHCQIARKVQGVEIKHPHLIQEEAGEEVSNDELKFEQWEIQQTGEKLFSVKNKLDEKESYSVHLGNPIGCTCGSAGCEHILVVLKS